MDEESVGLTLDDFPAIPAPTGGVRELALEELEAHPTNRAVVIDAEFVESVRTLGVLQPILVRPRPGSAEGYQVVAGHRRVAAAREAGRETVPALVRELDDRQTLEVRLVENLQRRDLHPLEEADGFRELIRDHGYTAEQLAARIHKSRGYVYGRLKLTELRGKARELFEVGTKDGTKLDASTALLVARVPESLQEEAARLILDGWGEPMPYREAVRLVQEKFMLELSHAPFDRKDETLVLEAGACGACPKRTGNAPDLFGDVKGKDVCTDPPCFGRKKAASWARRAAEAEAAGLAVLEGKKAEAALRSSEFVDVDQARDELNGKSVRKVLRNATPAAVLAQDHRGNAVQLVRRKELDAALREAGVAKVKRAPDAYQDERAKEAKKAKEKRAVGRALVSACLERAIAAKPADLWPIVEAFVWKVVHHETACEVAKRHQLEKTTSDPIGQLTELAKAAPKGFLKDTNRRELTLELILAEGMTRAWDQRVAGATLEAAAGVFGLDLAKLAAAARAEFRKPKARKAKDDVEAKAAPSKPARRKKAAK